MKRNITIAALAAMIGVPALGVTNANASSYSQGNSQTSQQIKYKKEAPGSHGYEPVFNNGNGAVDDVGDRSYAHNLTASQAEQYNNGQDSNYDGINHIPQQGSQHEAGINNQNQSAYESHSKDSLPQTSENFHAFTEIAGMSILAISAAFALAAHKQAKNYRLAMNNNVSASDNRNNAYNSLYSEIMASTFSSLHEELENDMK